MYAADGRTRYTLKSEVDAYKKVGWYTEPYTPPKTNSSSSGSSSGGSSSSGVVRGSTVYVTPSGKKYHYSASCAGKNARATCQQHKPVAKALAQNMQDNMNIKASLI